MSDRISNKIFENLVPYYRTTVNNTNTVTINLDTVPKSSYPRIFVLECGNWNANNAFGGIGLYRYAVENEASTCILANPNNFIASATVDSTARTLTVTMSQTVSYISLVIFAV